MVYDWINMNPLGVFLAILLVELVYAVVGIAWLVQYYQPCSDVTAKNLALGMWKKLFNITNESKKFNSKTFYVGIKISF